MLVHGTSHVGTEATLTAPPMATFEPDLPTAMAAERIASSALAFTLRSPRTRSSSGTDSPVGTPMLANR